MADLFGYARVSTTDQNPDLQLDALRAAGCVRVFTDYASGAKTARPEATQALEHLRAGDTLVVWKLDRLGRSLPHLVETVKDLADRDIGFRSLQDPVDTTTPGGRLGVPRLRGASRVRARLDSRAHERWLGSRSSSRPRRWPPTGPHYRPSGVGA